MHWYKHDPDAFIAGTAELTLEEVGAYSLILDALYARDGDLPDNDRFVSRILRCNPRTWRKVRAALMAKGKIWLTEDGKLMAKRVNSTLIEAFEFSERQSNRARMKGEKYKNPNENNEAPLRPRSAITSTSTKKESFLPSSVTTSERIQPSAELLAHEVKKRPAPGDLATAPFDSALARPAYAAASTKGARDPSTRPFTRAEAGKASGWEWENHHDESKPNGRKEAAE